MKKTLPLYTALLLSICLPALAQNGLYASQQPEAAPQAAATATAQTQASPMEMDVAALQQEWARIKYQVSDKDMQLDAIHKLEEQATAISAKYPHQAEPKIWEGIILSTDAGIVKGLSALGKVEKAKELFETSLKENPKALDGSAHTSLGSLYYQVPGWPVGFGDDEEAEKHLKTALQMNPGGIDPNYFYGDFLLQSDRYDEAKTYLSKALQAPDRPNRQLADAGRRQEIKAALAQIDQKMKDSGKSQYN